MPWVRSYIRNTFPIPKSEIRRRKWRMALKHPITWTPILPLGVLSAAAVSPAIIAGVVVAALAGVGVFWARRSKRLESDIVEDIIRDSNLAQDSELISLIRKLSRNGYESYAVTLGSFAGLKTKIERSLYQDDGHTPEKEQIGRLVDDLVFHVVDQLEAMAKIEYRLGSAERQAPPPRRVKELQDTWREMSDRVKRAHGALNETWHNLDVLLDPLPGAEITGARLDEAIIHLREENKIAEEIRRRVLADAQASDSLPPEDAAADAEIAKTFAAPHEYSSD